MKTYICNNELKESLLSVLLKDRPSIFGIEILSVNEFLSRIFNVEELNIYDLYLLVKDLPLTDLNESLNDADFLKEALNNRYLCDVYQIKIDELEIHEDYKKILKALPSLNIEALNLALQKDFSDYVIVDSYYPYFIAEKINKPLIKNGAETFKFATYANHLDYQIKTQNYRQGIDKIATYIIQKEIKIEDCAIVCSPDQFDLIQTNFNRYHIPTYSIRPTASANLAKVFVAFVDFCLNPNKEQFMELVSLNALKLEHNNSSDVRRFLKHHLKEFKLELCTDFNQDIIDPKYDAYYLNLQANYNEILGAYLPILKDLCNCANFEQVILQVFDLLKDDSLSTTRIKHTIEKYRANLKEAYPFLRQELLNIKLPSNTQGLQLVAFNEEVYLKKYLFVLNPDIKSYPGFKGRKGFLNEHVLEETNYPSIEVRYHHHLKMHDYLNASAYTFYLMPGSSIDGKANEFEEQLKHLMVYEGLELTENPEMHTPKHHLSSETAREVFFKDHALTGSISSFETYFRCPYAYFLNFGLDLYEPRLSERDPAATGTIIHKVFEVLVNHHGKDYVNATSEEIDEILQPYIDKYAVIHPLHPELNAAMFKRIKALILLEMQFMQPMENDTAYIPSKCEYRFKDHEFVNDGLDHVLLRGVIDRVDETADFFRIIDYKTSEHKLDEKTVKQGLQLQLLTYALVYQELTSQKPAGQFYLNVTDPKNTIEPFKYTKTNGITSKLPTKEEVEAIFISAHRLSGLVYVDDPNLDYEFKYVEKGRGANSFGTRIIDLDSTRALIKDIYRYLLNQLRNGDIALRPTEDACTYCNYHQICHFKGLKIKDPDPVVEGSLKKDKEEA